MRLLVKSQLIALIFMILCAFSVRLEAAEISIEPNLEQRVAHLKPIYPASGKYRYKEPGEELPLYKTLWGGTIDDENYMVPDYPADRSNPLLVDPVIFVRFSGQIVKGDFEKFKKFYLSHPAQIWVFEGPGGNFGEAYKIGKLIFGDINGEDPRIGGVYVLDDQTCLSACAVMAAWAGPHSLFVEPGSKIGFHLPFIPKENVAEFSKIPADQLLKNAYEISLAYNELLLTERVGPEFMRAVYQNKSSQDYFFLDSTYKLASNNFNAVSAQRGKPLHMEGLDLDIAGRLCETFLDRIPSSRTSITDYKFSDFYVNDKTHRTLRVLMKEQSANWFATNVIEEYSKYICTFGVDEFKSVHLRLTDRSDCKATLENEENLWGLCIFEDPRHRSYATNGQLDMILGCDLGIYDPRVFIEKGSEFSGQKEDTVLIPFAKRAVNIRQFADIDADKVGRLEAADKIKVVDCKTTDDKQSVWYNIQSGQGNGWVSARYIGGQYRAYLNTYFPKITDPL